VNKCELRSVVVETAQLVLDARGDDPEVRLQVEALIGSLDDGCLTRVLQELEPLKGRGPTFQQILADFPTLTDNYGT
jgi:hypothetical protein